MIISKKIGEELSIGNGAIQIKILSIDSGIIYLDIDAPYDIDIESKATSPENHFATK